MKIALITRHAISNYGSILQTIATQKVIQNLGNDVEVIDYVRKDEDYRYITETLLKKSDKWNRNFLTRLIYKVIQSPSYLIMGRKFREIQKKELNLTRRYISIDELEKGCPIADIYLTGSDQVWGPVGSEEYDVTYFLKFVNNVKKIAYAGSFGKTNFNTHIKNEYKLMLSDYSKIAVRENSAKKIVEEMLSTKVDQVLDPTLLITANEWLEYIKKDINTNYVLIYQLHANRKMDEYAKELAKRKNLPLIRITPSLHHVLRGGKVKFLPELGVFLSYIKNATYMITDSFHGTAFAINFGIQFINVSPGETATRNISILELTELENRMIKSYEDFNIFNEEIDYEKVDEILSKERQNSLCWIESALKGKV